MKICPSIASGDLLDLRSECRYIEEHFHHIHVDIEDGNYIDNITFGMKTLGELRKLCTCEMSVHLMVENPLFYLASMREIRPEYLFFHGDSCRYPSQITDCCKSMGVTPGLALNPADSLEHYLYLYPRIKDVLFMMCEPDGYGQSYQAKLEEKVKDGIGQGFRTWVDGDVNWERAAKAGQNGVTFVVMGRAIFCDRTAACENAKKLRSI